MTKLGNETPKLNWANFKTGLQFVRRYPDALNPYIPKVLQEVTSQLEHLQMMIEVKNTEAFSKWFDGSKNHFSKELLEKNYELFEKISRLMINSSD